MADVAMPRLSDSMEEGTILKWLKSDGDEVKRGEELVEIETDKANMTFEADSDGVLQIVAQEGDTLEIGKTIARLGDGAGPATGGDDAASEAPSDDDEEEEDGGEEQADDAGSADPPEETGSADEVEAEADADAAEGDANGRVKASPVAKRMARDLGLDLAELSGSGPGGRIIKSDVEAAAEGGEASAKPSASEPGAETEAPAPEKAPEPDVPPAPVPQSAKDSKTAKGEVTHQDLTKVQQVVARRMAESKATAPDFVLDAEVDMSAATEIRNRLKELAISSDRPAPSFNDMVVKACALALRDFPRANGAFRDGRFELYSRVNVGIAVAGQDALVVPTIYDADRKSLGDIARDSRALAERVRAGAVTPPELSGGTFTVSNLGMYGIRSFTAVINPPQAAILAVGEVADRAVVRDGAVVARPTMDVRLACDHRILYGAEAAEFLARIRDLLQEPLGMAL